jgi:hypothetical protein
MISKGAAPWAALFHFDRLRAPVAAMIAGVVVACAGGPQPQSAADLRLDMFEDVAFRREFTAARPMVIERWTGPLRIALEGSDATRYRADVQAYARLLAGLTRLDIAAARPGEAANA